MAKFESGKKEDRNIIPPDEKREGETDQQFQARQIQQEKDRQSQRNPPPRGVVSRPLEKPENVKFADGSVYEVEVPNAIVGRKFVVAKSEADAEKKYKDISGILTHRDPIRVGKLDLKPQEALEADPGSRPYMEKPQDEQEPQQ